jgi:type IX secretion system PorP/SprF family membrane protein
MNLGWAIRTINYGNLTLGDIIDSRYGFIYSSNPGPGQLRIGYVNLGGGLAFHNNRFIVGYYIDHINEPNLSPFLGGNSALPMKHVIHAAIKICNFNGDKINLSAIGFLNSNRTFAQLVLRISLNYKSIKLGTMQRLNDALIFCAGYSKDKFQVNYSYDIIMPRLTKKTAGSHELSVGLLLGKVREKKTE